MATKALLTTKRVEIIDKKKFAMATLNAEKETFVMHIAALAEVTIMPIHLSCQAQVALVKTKKPEFLPNIWIFLTSFFQTPR